MFSSIFRRDWRYKIWVKELPPKFSRMCEYSTEYGVYSKLIGMQMLLLHCTACDTLWLMQHTVFVPFALSTSPSHLNKVQFVNKSNWRLSCRIVAELLCQWRICAKKLGPILPNASLASYIHDFPPVMTIWASRVNLLCILVEKQYSFLLPLYLLQCFLHQIKQANKISISSSPLGFSLFIFPSFAAAYLCSHLHSVCFRLFPSTPCTLFQNTFSPWLSCN